MQPEYLARAIELSRDGMRAGAGGPFGAVIARGGEVIAEAFNRVLATNDPSNHAEMIAIRNAARALDSFDLSGCELYVNAEPCPMCLGAIYWAQLDQVYFANTRDDSAAIGFDDAEIYAEVGKEPDKRKIPFERVADPAARAVFAEWRATEGEARY